MERGADRLTDRTTEEPVYRTTVFPPPQTVRLRAFVRASLLSVDRQGDPPRPFVPYFALGRQSDGAVWITPEHGVRDPNILLQAFPPQGAAAHPQMHISQLLRRCAR